MEVSFTTQAATEIDADTIALGIHAERGGKPGKLPPGAPAELAQLIDSGEAQGSFESLALGHANGRRWLLVGLGPQAELTPERARVAAALARERARELSTRRLCWLVPQGGEHASEEALAAALVEGTVLADYSFELFKSAPPEGERESAPPKHLESLTIADDRDLEQTVADAAAVTEAVNGARDLQNRPGNDLTPTALAEHAIALAAADAHLSVEVEGREGLHSRAMGAFAAVAQGSAQEPALITLRYEPPKGPAQGAPTLGLVGKAVTFDSGGISLKPGAKMSEMKFDMSGGAAVLQATAAIARLQLPLKVIAVVGATENLPSGSAVKPGDIVKAANGKTIEINNTDAEGRLVLEDP